MDVDVASNEVKSAPIRQRRTYPHLASRLTSLAPAAADIDSVRSAASRSLVRIRMVLLPCSVVIPGVPPTVPECSSGYDHDGDDEGKIIGVHGLLLWLQEASKYDLRDHM